MKKEAHWHFNSNKERAVTYKKCYLKYGENIPPCHTPLQIMQYDDILILNSTKNTYMYNITININISVKSSRQ